MTTNPGSQLNGLGDVVNLPIIATDADGDTLSYSATGLPDGLTIDTVSGVISGAPTTAGSNAVTVTVSDGTDSASVSFSWDINTLPNVTNPGAQVGAVGSAVNLPIVATDADGDNYLENVASGFGAGGRMTMFNQSQWQGDLVAAGITEIRAHVKVETTSESALTLRVGFQSLAQLGLQQGYVSLVPVVVQNDGNWYEVVFPITSDDLVAIGSLLTYNQTMTDVGHFRIYHATNVAWQHFTEIAATMGVDNITGNVGPVDDFEDGTTQNWKEGPASPTQPTNVSTGGPDGAGDILSFSATGLPTGLSIDATYSRLGLGLRSIRVTIWA